MGHLVKIDELLSERGMTMEELAEASGVEIARLERFAREEIASIRLPEVMAIADVFGCQRTDVLKIFHW